MFPSADIRIREEAHAFLRQMKSLIDERGGFETRITIEPPSDTHCSCLGFSPFAPQSHEGLVGLFVNWAHEYPVIRLQTIASRWNPEWPTYQVVRDAAESLFTPALKAYNKRFGTRYRIRIDTQEQTLPKLSPAAQKSFNEFAHGANLRALHPLDWERFYRFVRVCHATKNDLYESDVAFFLRKAGFSSEYSNFISQIFCHCRDFYIQSDWRRELSYRKRRAPRRSSPEIDGS